MEGARRKLSSWNRPGLVAACGALIVAELAFSPKIPLPLLKTLNLVSFLANLVATSMPGRIDWEDSRIMAPEDDNDPTSEECIPILNPRDRPPHLSSAELRQRSYFRPSPWAFVIWGFIYLGEAILVIAQFVTDRGPTDDALEALSLSFVAANLLQSLWCASFRPRYDKGCHRYVSVFMLGSTTYSLSRVPPLQSVFFIPLACHFGWTTAATFVNLNASIASNRHVSDLTLLAAGHVSVVAATVFGVAIPSFEISTEAYGLTIAWALAAVACNIEIHVYEDDWSDALQSGARVQRTLAWAGSVLAITASAFQYLIMEDISEIPSQ